MPSTELNVEPYKHLMVYASADAIPIEAVASKMGASAYAVGSYIAGAKKSIGVYEKLRAVGYADTSIPSSIDHRFARHNAERSGSECRP